jgi:PI-3-kinase-related kinase SMG-1
MGWACAGPNTSSAGGSTAKGSGIPPEFHGHLLKRRKLLRVVQKEASDLVQLCTSVLEFEASRDGLYFVPEDKASEQSTDKGRAWQQTFLNLLARLDAAYHSFTCKLTIHPFILPLKLCSMLSMCAWVYPNFCGDCCAPLN